jgi:membrane dipeptidase
MDTEKIPYFDAHCDTVYRCAMTGEGLGENHGHVDLRRGRQFARYAQFFALFAAANKAPLDGMTAQCRRLHSVFTREMETNRDSVSHCTTAGEIDRAVESGKCAALLSIEGGDLLDCDPGRVEEAEEWGVRLLNPVWNCANVLSGTNCEEEDRGLSPQGKEFIRALEEHHIYADVSHLSRKGFWDLYDMAQRPIVASHSNAGRICNHRRNLSDEQFCAIRDSGGVVGMNYYSDFVGGKADLDTMIAHIEHFWELGGEKTVCLGGDLDGCESLVGGWRGMEDVPTLYAALQSRHYSNELLEDLFWNNLKRLF